MTEGFECRYNYVLLDSDHSTDTADEEEQPLLEKMESEFHYSGDDLNEYEYVWLSDNETLLEGRNRTEETNSPNDSLKESRSLKYNLEKTKNENKYPLFKKLITDDSYIIGNDSVCVSNNVTNNVVPRDSDEILLCAESKLPACIGKAKRSFTEQTQENDTQENEKKRCRFNNRNNRSDHKTILKKNENDATENYEENRSLDSSETGLTIDKQRRQRNTGDLDILSTIARQTEGMKNVSDQTRHNFVRDLVDVQYRGTISNEDHVSERTDSEDNDKTLDCASNKCMLNTKSIAMSPLKLNIKAKKPTGISENTCKGIHKMTRKRRKRLPSLFKTECLNESLNHSGNEMETKRFMGVSTKCAKERNAVNNPGDCDQKYLETNFNDDDAKKTKPSHRLSKRKRVKIRSSFKKDMFLKRAKRVPHHRIVTKCMSENSEKQDIQNCMKVRKRTDRGKTSRKDTYACKLMQNSGETCKSSRRKQAGHVEETDRYPLGKSELSKSRTLKEREVTKIIHNERPTNEKIPVMKKHLEQSNESNIKTKHIVKQKYIKREYRHKEQRCQIRDVDFNEIFHGVIEADETCNNARSCEHKKREIRSKRTNIRRKQKEVRVFRTVKGIGRIEFKYPCKFCGELFSKGYVVKHEKTHLKESCSNPGKQMDPGEASLTNNSLEFGGKSFIETETVTKTPPFSEEQTSFSADCNRNLEVSSLPLPDYGDLSTMMSSITLEDGKYTKKADSKKKSEEVHCTKYDHTEGVSEEGSTNNEKRRTIYSDDREKQSKEKLTEYSCSMCSYSCQYKGYLKRHCTMHKSCSKTVTCKCGITFRNKLSLKQWHRRNSITCRLEHYTIPTDSKISRRKVRVGKISGILNDGDKKVCFSDESKSLKENAKTNAFTTTNKSCLAEHNRKKGRRLSFGSETPKELDIGFGTNKREIKKVTKIGQPSEARGKHCCNICSYSASHKWILKRHLKVHRSCRKTVTCKCGIVFLHRLAMRMWHKRNNISCESKQLAVITNVARIKPKKRNRRIVKDVQKKHLKRNIDLNSADPTPKTRTNKRLKCNECNYRFSNTSNWIKHEQLHKESKGCTCEKCSITMKSRQSLAFWHHRHGIRHPKIHKKNSTRAAKAQENQMYKIDQSTKEQQSQNINTDELSSCDNCDALIAVNGLRPGKLNEKLDGTTCEKCFKEKKSMVSNVPERYGNSHQSDGLKSIDKDHKYVKENQATDFRKKINKSLKDLSLKFEAEGNGRPKMDRPESRRGVSCYTEYCHPELTDVDKGTSSEIDSVIRQSKESRCSSKFFLARTSGKERTSKVKNYKSIGSTRKDTKKTSMEQEEIHVYPLSKRLSLKEGERVFNPINGGIEVFEKDIEICNKYCKVGMMNFNTNKPLHKSELKKHNSLSLMEETFDVSENNDDKARISSPKETEPLDLSLKTSPQGQQEICPGKEKPKVKISFKIQMDLCDEGVTNSDPSKQESSAYRAREYSSAAWSSRYATKKGPSRAGHVSSSSVMNNSKDFLRVLKSNDDISCNLVQTGIIDMSRDHSIHKIQSMGGHYKDNLLIEGKLIAESDVHGRNSFSGDVIMKPNNNDVYLFTDDESGDEIYYASKLKGCSDYGLYATNYDHDKDIQMERQSRNANIMEDYVCDVGETDENNNRGKESNNPTSNKDAGGKTDNVRNNIDGAQNANSGSDGDRGNGDDGNGNNDRNNSTTNSTSEIQNVELLPCLVCQETFSSKTELLRHLTRIHRLTNLCQICYFDEGEIRRFANPVSLRNHKVRDHPEDMVKCVCGAMLIDNKMLSSHLKKFRCNTCETGSDSKQMAKCICGKRFSSQEMLLNHRSKCRKRHCLDETFLEYMTSNKGKKRYLKTSAVENVNPTDTTGMILRPRPIDVNNNMKSSDICEYSHGRISKVRKCKENVLSYSERTYDKIFETAVNLSNFQRAKSVDKFGQSQSKRVLPEYCNISNDEVLDLRVKTARDRSISARMKEETIGFLQRDDNNNFTVRETSEGKAYKIPTGNKTGGKTVGTSSINTRQNLDINIKSISRNLNSNMQNKPRRKTKSSQLDNITRTMKFKCVTPSSEVQKYPCRICRRRFTKPHLNIHKTFHSRTQWSLVPSSPGRHNSGKNVRYRCSWCRFVSVHWGTAVRHHYKNHQREELDLVTLTMLPDNS